MKLCPTKVNGINYNSEMSMIKYKFNREVYSKIALMKAAYNYTDKAYVHLDVDHDYYTVELNMKDGYNSITEKQFLNEILAQSIRHEVFQQTKNIRELMLARAMATTVINEEEKAEQSAEITEQFIEKDIIKDWFATDVEAENE